MLIVGQRFINPLVNRIKVVTFTAKYTIKSNFLKKKKMDANFFKFCVFYKLKFWRLGFK